MFDAFERSFLAIDEDNEMQDEISEALTDTYEDYDQTRFEERPSKGYETLEDEKNDLLYKLSRFASKGLHVNKKYNVNSNISELRQEYHRIKREIEVNASIKFSRRMLMACVTGIEFMNKRYDPFNIYLDGWSESLMENMDDYDNVFEKLHDKYKNSVNVPPEIELLMSLAGSAFMFHLTSTMFKSMPNIGDMAKQNPEIIKTMMETMTSAAKQSQSNAQAQPPVEIIEETNDSIPAVREMRKPSLDMSMLPSGMMLPMQVIPEIDKPINTSVEPKLKFDEPQKVTNSVVSLSPASTLNSSIFEDSKHISVTNSNKKRGSRKKNLNVKDENTISL